MKLGNYKWMVCPKCGERYIWIPTKRSNHKCKKSKIKELIKRLFDK